MEPGFADQLIPVGSILKTVGYQGALLIDTYPDFDLTWDHMDQCLIRVDGVWAPFFIVSKEHKQDGLLVLFEDLGDNKLAKSLIHEEIFVLKTQVIIGQDNTEDKDEIEGWLGFTIYDIDTSFSGVIEELEELPSQLLAHVTYEGKRIVIPLADELIIELDPEKKTVKMDLPQGLLDL